MNTRMEQTIKGRPPKRQRSRWARMCALVMAFAVYAILDIEYPRFGLIRVDAFDQALVDLRESMDQDIQSPGQK